MKPIHVLAPTIAIGMSILMVPGSLSSEAESDGLSIDVGPGYYAILPNKILLSGEVLHPGPEPVRLGWTKESGPGEVRFERPAEKVTWATATVPGRYVFKLRATAGSALAEATTSVNVYPTGAYFGNPILPGMFPDPHILFDEGQFHIYATSMENEEGAYGRASVWTSEDFVNWEMKLTNWPEYGRFGGDIWAPDIIRKGDRFYQFITRSGAYDTWIGVADAPGGPWSNLREDNTPIVSGGGRAGRIVAAYNMDSMPMAPSNRSSPPRPAWGLCNRWLSGGRTLPAGSTPMPPALATRVTFPNTRSTTTTRACGALPAAVIPSPSRWI